MIGYNFNIKQSENLNCASENGAADCFVPCERSESNTYYGTLAVCRYVAAGAI